ncbi:MAG: MgtC/SapB family protein [Pseudobdellovibrionaceae bacterium]
MRNIILQVITPLNMEDVHPLQQFIISISLGLLVGLQREWAESPLGGIRTFSLISLLGTTCALLAEEYSAWIIVGGFTGSIFVMAMGQWKKKTPVAGHSSLVTEFGMLLMFVVGVFIHVKPIWIGVSLAGLVAVILQAKIELHKLAVRLSEKEIRAIMQFVLISLVIFPVLPNQYFGPLKVLNPHEIWLMVVLIVAISLTGYIAYKFLGEKAGTILGGVLGGIISSTATTINYAKQSKGAAIALSQNALVIIIAWTISYVRVFLEAVLASPRFQTVWAPLGIIFLVSLLSALWLWRKRLEGNTPGMPKQSNPTELKTALIFGVIYSIILLGVAFAKQYYGNSGLRFVAFLSGITDMDAITLSTSRLVAAEKISPSEGWPIIIIALMSNLLFKGGIAGFLGGKEFLKMILIPWLVSLLAGFALLLFW